MPPVVYLPAAVLQTGVDGADGDSMALPFHGSHTPGPHDP